MQCGGERDTIPVSGLPRLGILVCEMKNLNVDMIWRSRPFSFCGGEKHNFFLLLLFELIFRLYYAFFPAFCLTLFYKWRGG